MLKSYDELVKVNVDAECEERDGIKYLNWAKCMQLLHEHGAEKVYFEPIIDERTGSSLFHSDLVFDNEKSGKDHKINRCYEVRVHIVIDALEFDYNYPLMNGTNAVCDNSLNQLRVSNAQKRAFVKGVAERTGLGFYLWLKDADIEEKQEQEPDIYVLKQLRKMFNETISKLMYDKNMTPDDIAKAVGLTDGDSLKARFAMFGELYEIMEKMSKL